MAAPTTAAEFIELIRKSGVVDENRLEPYLQKLDAAGDAPSEASKMAGVMVRDGMLTHFQAEQVMAGKWRRFSIGRFKVLERLGSGGMGSVFLCEHKAMRRRVAIKILPTAKANDDATRERFYREARAAAALDHTNIVHAYDIDQDEQLHFIVMEYVNGASLQEIVKKTGPLNVTRACHYIYYSALGLQHAHEKGLIHRDIKPGNILVDRTGVVKILDMGLARIMNDEDDMLTKKYDETVLGTADYLSPEQALDSHEVDIRADIYSLGATFYFLLTGRPPFPEGTIPQKLLAHQQKQPKPLSDYRQDIPAGLIAILSKMMAKKADQRYATPAEIVDVLRPYTTTPIDPPAESELPKLSPMLGGQSESDGADTTVLPASASKPASVKPAQKPLLAKPASSTKPKTPAPAPAKSPPLAKPATPPPAKLKPISMELDTPTHKITNPSKPNRESASPAVVPILPAIPVAEEEQLPWNTSLTDTTEFRSDIDTSPDSHASSRKLAQAHHQSERTRKQVRSVLLWGSVPVTLFFITLVVIYWPRSIPAPVVPKINHLIVTRDTGKPNSYPTIKQALKHAQSGDIIELADAVHKESLVIEVGVNKVAPNVTLQVAPGIDVVWRPAQDDLPIISFTRAESFTLKGNRLTLDGNLGNDKKLKSPIVISLRCPGLAIEDLTIKGFSQSAIKVINGAGEENRPIRIVGLKAEDVNQQRPALYFDTNPQILTVSVNDYFEGSIRVSPPSGENFAIQKKDDTVVGNNISFKTP